MHNCFYEENCSSKQHQLFQLQFLASHQSFYGYLALKSSEIWLKMDVSKAATKLPTLENRSLILNFIAYTQWALLFPHAYARFYNSVFY